MHDITHPQLACVLKGETAAVAVCGLIAVLLHQAMADKQPMDSGWG
jgi:hypothetical protein